MEELLYTTVMFEPRAVSTNAVMKPDVVIYEELKAEPQSPTVNTEVVKDSERIYDELKAEEKPQIHIYNVENRREATVCPNVALVAAGLGFVCVGLLLTVIAVSLHMNRLNSKCLSETVSLRNELSRLQTLTEDLRTDKEDLNWTLSVIMKYTVFPVTDYCPQRVCNSCLDGWLLFQSSCYYFDSSRWKSWQKSREFCKNKNADLVTIQSQEEQEFISNHTERFSENYGYWIGFRETNKVWSWVDGSEPNGSYWVKEPLYEHSCVLTLLRSDPLSTWRKEYCGNGNRWICETPALIRPH